MKNQILFLINLPRVFIVALPYLFASGKTSVRSDMAVLVSKGRAKNCSLLSLCKVLYFNKYYRNIYYHRMGKIAKAFRWLAPEMDTFHIANVKLGEGVFGAHPYATYLNARVIGRNFSFRNCITIGNKSDDRVEEIPTIGNNVSVGANAVIIGNIHIGNNVIIGAGAVVVSDVPDNCVVVGNPAKIIRQNRIKVEK